MKWSQTREIHATSGRNRWANTKVATNLRVGGVGADVVDPPRDLEVEDGVEGVLAAVDDVRRQLQLLPAADDVRAFAAMFMRSFVQCVLLLGKLFSYASWMSKIH